ncbi:PAS domain S-box protein [Methylocystis sp. Sn-Cys]|uniref:hybrid sensor histidine kinase/response regulator n=1 Tax=Methylocystis sp. Sn-Cys TaxID=1701263 RepID=UPI0019204563|nr:PAS domain S-box protein [Methylocystis sp. Sn-Cys]MBL1255384.1 PAS domain S-box protein [Methylocystis sp. Sn-Cys]
MSIQQKATTNAVSDGGALLRALFDAIPGRAAFLDVELRYRYVNREFLASLGTTEDCVVGKCVEEVLGPEASASYRAAMPGLVAGKPQHLRRTIEEDGVRRSLEEELKPFAPGGAMQGVVCVAHHVAEPQECETTHAEWLESHKAREAIHSAVVDSALDCIVVIDAQGHVVEFNPAAAATFGYSREEAIGKTVAELIVPPEMRASHDAGLARFRSGGPSSVIGKRVELEAMCANGSRIPIELAITAVGSGPSALFTAHLRDLRPTREAQAQIERQREALYQSEKLAALGSLLAGVAHELNNPLSIVIGQALMLREAAQAHAILDKQFEEFADRGTKIETAANRCARIVKIFLAMARQREAERGRVEIPELVERVLELLSYGLRTAGIEVTKDIPADLPPLLADSDQLHQVLLNLVVNAKQALEAQPAPRRIAIVARAEPSTQKLEILISDNGPGVPEAIRNRIFDPFFTTKPQGVGTGIGLAVSRGLIEAHGGSLVLEPQQPGMGAVFMVRLPIEATETAVVTTGSAPSQPATRQRRALIVDDEVEIAGLLAEILRRLAFDCEIATSGEQAKQALAEKAVDLILCDIRMPNGDGPALYDWLGVERPQMTNRIAFVTGDILGPAADRFIARSGCPVVEKPFAPEEIRQVVDLLCDETGA